MKILITNDDGIDALGINVLAQVFCKDNDCFMVAPSSNCSATSHSLTIHRDLSFEKADKACPAYAVGGTPADCVKLGIIHFGFKPDIIISGINNGPNLGSDIMYSGTVSAAAEGVYLGIKSVAISMEKWNCDEELYRAAALFLRDRLKGICSLELGKHTLLNVNYPVKTPYKGVKVTKAGINLYSDGYVANGNPDVVRLVGEPISHGLNDGDCDVELIKQGYATVTPILTDRNDYAKIDLIKGAEIFK